MRPGSSSTIKNINTNIKHRSNCETSDVIKQKNSCESVQVLDSQSGRDPFRLPFLLVPSEKAMYRSIHYHQRRKSIIVLLLRCSVELSSVYFKLTIRLETTVIKFEADVVCGWTCEVLIQNCIKLLLFIISTKKVI